MKAWYFAHESNKLQYEDGREIKIGETHTVDCIPQCCKQGLHGSLKLIDALFYAKGPIVYRVDIKGKIDKEQDKICGQSRTYLYGGINVKKELHEFARLCALKVATLWCAPEIVIRYLKTGDRKLRFTVLDIAWKVAWNSNLETVKFAAKATAMAIMSEVSNSLDGIIEALDSAWCVTGDKTILNRKLTQLINKEIRSRT
jgi:hypothetical protein